MQSAIGVEACLGSQCVTPFQRVRCCDKRLGPPAEVRHWLPCPAAFAKRLLISHAGRYETATMHRALCRMRRSLAAPTSSTSSHSGIAPRTDFSGSTVAQSRPGPFPPRHSRLLQWQHFHGACDRSCRQSRCSVSSSYL